ncbi:MAG: non-hydrolyzing UDP-N-acetylglucosamine 2-epimerase [Cryomorphaceae bacterium]
MKILTIVGARPQFVKAATISRAVAATAGVEEVIIHTGQHFDANMSEVFFKEMDIPEPRYNLDIHSLGHGAMTGRMLEAIEKIILDEQPDVLQVYGDTNSTLAGALAARKLHVKVGHVEAGLRSFNMAMPEEVNRILTDRISDFLYCPTDSAVANLHAEGFDGFQSEVVRTGDVMLDAARYYAQHSAEKSTLDPALLRGDFALCTLHRAENTDDPARLSAFAEALNRIHHDSRVILPLHPRTKAKLKTTGIELQVDLIDPVGYFEMIELLKHCSLVLTDSGGLQKEAFFFGKNCVTLRDQTEWVELVEQGYNVLAEPDADDVMAKHEEMRLRKNDFSRDLYGDGNAAEAIVRHLTERL